MTKVNKETWELLEEAKGELYEVKALFELLNIYFDMHVGTWDEIVDSLPKEGPSMDTAALNRLTVLQGYDRHGVLVRLLADKLQAVEDVLNSSTKELSKGPKKIKQAV